MASVEHFEIPADDVHRAQAFYGKVFGFTFEDWGGGNIMLRTGSDAGINGDIHQRGPVPHPTVVISVDDLEETIAAAVEGGGEQVEIGPVVVVREEGRLTAVAALGHVMRHPGGDGAGETGHGPTLAGPSPAVNYVCCP